VAWIRVSFSRNVVWADSVISRYSVAAKAQGRPERRARMRPFYCRDPPGQLPLLQQLYWQTGARKLAAAPCCRDAMDRPQAPVAWRVNRTPRPDYSPCRRGSICPPGLGEPRLCPSTTMRLGAVRQVAAVESASLYAADGDDIAPLAV